MRVYVAAKTHDYHRARKVMDELIGAGHTITFDWTKNVEEVGPDHENEKAADLDFLLKCAENDVYGVKTAQALVALDHPKLCGTLVEIGMAIPKSIPIVLSGEFRKSVFWELPQIIRVGDDSQIVKVLTPSWSIED